MTGQIRSHVMDRVFRGLCESLDTPVSLGMWLRYNYKEHVQLADSQIRPEWYSDVDSFRKDYLVVSYLSKYMDLETGYDLNAVALKKFEASEEVCSITNSRLRKDRLRLKDIAVGTVIQRAQRKILALLGERPPDDWMSRCKWGPGATFSVKRRDAQVDNKVLEDPTSVSAFALRHFRRVISTDFQWLRSFIPEVEGPTVLLNKCFDVVQGARYFSVPKNAKGNRSALAEPTANAYLQSGVGRLLRRFLRQVGIDLQDQSRNQEGARTAVEHGWATIDLSSASDLIAIEVVRTLLPESWFQLLDDLRSHAYLHPEQGWVGLHKFSSMGNGFTFELETLIFWALSQAAIDELKITDLRTEKRARSIVYGDDILIPCAAYDLLERTFTALGFSINPEKSYVNGQFRESCGKHYFMGKDVTPIYQKEALCDTFDPRGCGNLLERYRGANRLRRLAHMWGGGVVCDDILRPAWRAASYGLPRDCVVPLDSEDDSGLALPIGEMDIRAYQAYSPTTIKHKPNKPNYQSGISCRVLSFTVSKRYVRGLGALVYTLHTMPQDDLEEFLPKDSSRVQRIIARAVGIKDREPFWFKIPMSTRGKYAKRWRQFPGERGDGPWVSRSVPKETFF